MRLLILGGTTEASVLADAIAGRADIAAVLSLAGRTRSPAPSPIPTRIGGFGGAEGLSAYLDAEHIDAVVDATHPFAAQMSRHAAEACRAAKLPLLIFTRPPWERQSGDRWIDVATMEEAARTLGDIPRNVFLTQGRLQLGAFAGARHHRYIVRAIERPDKIDALPRHRLILARGPFRFADEEALMRAESIEFLVSKNSGGEATYAKIEAARNLGLPVVMVRRPAKPDVERTTRLEEVLAWLDTHRAAP
ncbi:cobalt-precorrin-6A reductase [Methylocapsa sp. S129]|uniref:cobalt-precorrin-6A reductase n=1 Tax=Methylocapsa sp. S129 TaxID=1641869 RepID=UPI00131AEB10|nr:cobalt-precorrin-6A reductase [Methylocapsa sp. S129]